MYVVSKAGIFFPIVIYWPERSTVGYVEENLEMEK
jgi:hypothetical protein